MTSTTDKTAQTLTPPTAAQDAAAVVRDLAENLGHVERIRVPFDDDPVYDGPLLVSVPRGRTVLDLTPYIDKLCPYPRRRHGVFAAQTVGALIEWTNRFKSDQTAAFLDRGDAAAKLTVIADYHPEGPWQDNLHPANWCAHRADYTFPISRQWNAWKRADGEQMDVSQFGAFLDDNAADLLDPTPAMMGDGEPATNWERAAIDTARRLDGRFADVSTMLAMGREFRVFSTDRAEVTVNRTTGEAQIAFSEEHSDAMGQKMRLPSLFMIRVPVLDRGEHYALVVRFGYRKAGPKLRYALHDPDRALDDAIEGACTHFQEATGVPLLHGIPERAPEL